MVSRAFGRTIRLTNSYKPFQHGDRIPVDPPGTVAIVRGSRTVEDEGGELMQEYVVQLERPGQRSRLILGAMRPLPTFGNVRQAGARLRS